MKRLNISLRFSPGTSLLGLCESPQRLGSMIIATSSCFVGASLGNYPGSATWLNGSLRVVREQAYAWGRVLRCESCSPIGLGAERTQRREQLSRLFRTEQCARKNTRPHESLSE